MNPDVCFVLFFSQSWANCYGLLDLKESINQSIPNQLKLVAGLKALKSAANGRYLMCKSFPYYLHLLYKSTFIMPVKCMLGLFVFS